MFTRNPVRVTILVGLVFLIPQAFAQKPAPNSDPQTKPRKIKEEPDKAFTDWLRDVEPILTADELKAWPKLRTNAEREQFIAEVWHRRDPDPDTEENEYREAYYERLAYVNEHFASGTPGYKTDRGRIYLKYGKPDEVESHPAGGPYERASYEGGGSTTTYPFERWFYRNIPGRPGAEIEFVDPTGTGEYRLARNPFEKEGPVLMIPGAASMLNGVSQPDRVAAANGIGNPFSMREQDSPFNWQELLGILSAPLPAPKYDPFGETLTITPKLEDNPLNFETSFGFFRLDENRVVTTVTIQTENKELQFRDSGGVQVANINITGRIINVVGRRVNFFEDAVSTTATTEELIEAKDRKSAYQKTVVLAPGHYKADLMVRDTKTGATGLRHIGFIVPKFGSDLATSSLILASVLEHIDAPGSGPFLIGSIRVIPNISGAFHQSSPIGVYLQIYNAGIDQTTLRPAVDVEYALMKDGKELSKQVEDWRGSNTNGERLTLSRLIDSRGLATGEYAVEVRARDRVSGQSLVQTAKLTIVR